MTVMLWSHDEMAQEDGSAGPTLFETVLSAQAHLEVASSPTGTEFDWTWNGARKLWTGTQRSGYGRVYYVKDLADFPVIKSAA